VSITNAGTSEPIALFTSAKFEYPSGVNRAAYNVCVSICTPHNAWEMYNKMCCVLTQIIVIYLFSLFNDKLYSYFRNHQKLKFSSMI